MSYLGFDTSNYTTSLAVLNAQGAVVENRRILLRVKEKERGLRQSDALFLHIKNLPALLDGLSLFDVQAVGASVRPRDAEGSYMPVFLASYDFGLLCAKTLRAAFYQTSHQNGHLYAALRGNVLQNDTCFFAVQLSGGTFELLLVEKKENLYVPRLLASSIDITAGQLIDRIGVAMGERFPAGAAMDALAKEVHSTYGFSPSVNERGVSFAGLETKIRRHYLPDTDAAAQRVLYRSIFEVIAKSVALIVRRAHAHCTQVQDLLLMGGVCESETLRLFLHEFLGESYALHYAPKGLSADNAVGIASYAKACYEREMSCAKNHV